MERYSIEVDEDIRTAKQLFARYTDTIYLGRSGIENWDSFEDLFRTCFEHRDILVDVFHKDLSGLGVHDLEIYQSVLAEATSRQPNKLRIKELRD